MGDAEDGDVGEENDDEVDEYGEDDDAELEFDGEGVIGEGDDLGIASNGGGGGGRGGRFYLPFTPTREYQPQKTMEAGVLLILQKTLQSLFPNGHTHEKLSSS